MSAPPIISLPPAELDLKAELKTLGCTNFKLRQLMRQVSQHYDLEMASAGLKTCGTGARSATRHRRSDCGPRRS